MADAADIAQADAERMEQLQAPRTPYAIPFGGPGECRVCGVPHEQLVGGRCTECRGDDERRRRLNGGF